VLAEVQGERPDLIVCGGDVAWGPMPAETIERLRELGDRARFVMGNTDREMVAAYDEGARLDDPADLVERWTNWSSGQLDRAARNFLAGFEHHISLDVTGLGQTLFCHGSPRSDTEIITSLTSEERLARMIAGVDERVVVCGHTHIQFDRSVLGTRVINAGSVGLPYEGHAAAYWLLLGPDVVLRRTEYDVRGALPVLAAAGVPDFDEMVKESLLEPVAPRTVAEFFERQAGG
jgi:predicted phosphodiesterase